MSALKIENRDGALWVTFNRPDHFNSLDPESMCAIMDMWQQAETDDSVRLVVLTGTGDRAFLRRCGSEAVDTTAVRRPATRNRIRPPSAQHA
jgi:1,4-dihydroxy-2-naphthoyl-CoA synthase